MSLHMHPVADPRAFRHALGQFPTGVCVVTCAPGGVPHGMTMSSFNTLSIDPPLVLFSIDRRALSLPEWERADAYAINVLAEGQTELSNRFANPRGRKWEGVDYHLGPQGAPVLPGVVASYECVPHACHDGGDHVLFVVRVSGYRTHPERRPLVFWQGRYMQLDPGRPEQPSWPLDIHY
ncbi:flavin reductase family protein [Alkalilacustris brevis]|uniref:flavin reductase family protein n=1 Tax=Alkalilacustris brevis TaxID=2026338 RepID=UPI00192E7348|nr:flavin reductase family protein [Alkalilacustris brevis]